MIEHLKDFMTEEKITLRNLFSPNFVLNILHRHRYTHFFATGVTGVIINLLVTSFFAELVFGRARYFDAYLLGIAANLVYNFTLHTLVTFRTDDRHIWRFIIFASYSLLMTALQAYLVKIITPLIGINYYLFVITSIIFAFSTVSFFVFKLALFRK